MTAQRLDYPSLSLHRYQRPAWRPKGRALLVGALVCVPVWLAIVWLVT